jgi:hypothetical protein
MDEAAETAVMKILPRVVESEPSAPSINVLQAMRPSAGRETYANANLHLVQPVRGNSVGRVDDVSVAGVGTTGSTNFWRVSDAAGLAN